MSSRRRSSEPTDPYALVPMSDSLRALAQRGELMRRRKGQSLINEGDIGDTLYIVLKGELRAYSVGADGSEITFGRYGPGAYVGEMGFDGEPRSANVDATQPTLCAMVTRKTLLEHLEADPHFALELLAKVIGVARAATVGLRQIALKTVYGRLKDELYRIARPRTGGGYLIAPAPSQKDFSQTLGCSRHMITKVMQELVVGGYVKADYAEHRIEILKPLPERW